MVNVIKLELEHDWNKVTSKIMGKVMKGSKVGLSCWLCLNEHNKMIWMIAMIELARIQMWWMIMHEKTIYFIFYFLDENKFDFI